MALKVLIPLLCLAVLLTANAQDYKQAKHFKLSKLLDVKWYDLFYANNDVGELSVCTRWLFTPQHDGSIIYQFGFFALTLDGEFTSATSVLLDKDHGGRLTFADAPEGSYFYVLDYDKNYDWVIIADTYTFGGFMTLLSKTPENLNALDRMMDVAAKYGKTSHHLGLHTKKCAYNKIFNLLEDERDAL